MKSFASLSMLDLLCCAFGGVISLAVVFSALIRSQEAIQLESFLVVEASFESLVPATPEIDSEIRNLFPVIEMTEPRSETLLRFRSAAAGRPVLQGAAAEYSFSQGRKPGLRFATVIGNALPAGSYHIALALYSRGDVAPDISNTPVVIKFIARYPSRSKKGEQIWRAEKSLQELYELQVGSVMESPDSGKAQFSVHLEP